MSGIPKIGPKIGGQTFNFYSRRFIRRFPLTLDQAGGNHLFCPDSPWMKGRASEGCEPISRIASKAIARGVKPGELGSLKVELPTPINRLEELAYVEEVKIEGKMFWAALLAFRSEGANLIFQKAYDRLWENSFYHDTQTHVLRGASPVAQFVLLQAVFENARPLLAELTPQSKPVAESIFCRFGNPPFSSFALLRLDKLRESLLYMEVNYLCLFPMAKGLEKDGLRKLPETYFWINVKNPFYDKCEIPADEARQGSGVVVLIPGRKP